MRMHNAAIQERSTKGNYFWDDAVLCWSISIISLCRTYTAASAPEYDRLGFYAKIQIIFGTMQAC